MFYFLVLKTVGKTASNISQTACKTEQDCSYMLFSVAISGMCRSLVNLHDLLLLCLQPIRLQIDIPFPRAYDLGSARRSEDLGTRMPELH